MSKERPIPFTAENAGKIYAGLKWQTRRIVKNLGIDHPNSSYAAQFDFEREHGGALMGMLLEACPYGVPGDRLWAREPWSTVKWFDHLPPRDCHPYDRPPMLWYKADPQNSAHALSVNRGKPRSGMFMPRWASRQTLEITEIRVERLQDISEEDAIAEGCQAQRLAFWSGFVRLPDGGRSLAEMFTNPDNPGAPPADFENPELQRVEFSAKDNYKVLWDSINGKTNPWASNPWVWVIGWPARPAGEGAKQ